MKTSKKLLASLCTAVLVLTSMATLFTGTVSAAGTSEGWNLLKPDTAFAASGSNTYANGVTKITSAGEVNFTGLTSLTADDSFIIEATINLATVGPENWHGPRIRVRYTDEQNYYFVNFYGSHMAVEGNYIHEDGSLQGYGWAPTYANTNYIRSANSTIKVKIISHPESISVYVDDILMIDNAPVKKMNVLTGFQSTDNDTTYTAKAVISRAFPANDVPAAPTGFVSLITPTSEVSASPAASFANGVVSMNGLSELLFTNLPLTADDTFILKTKIDLTSVGAEGWHGPRITVRKNSETEYTQIAFLDGAVSLLGGYTLENGEYAGFGWGPYQNWNYDRVAGTVIDLTVVSAPNKLIVYIDDVKVFDLVIPEKQNPYVYFYSTDANTVYSTSGLSLYKEYSEATDIPAQPATSSNLITGLNILTTEFASFANGTASFNGISEMVFSDINALSADETLIFKTKINLATLGAEGWHGPRITIRKTDEENYYQLAFLDGGVAILGNFTNADGLQGYGWGPYINYSYDRTANSEIDLTIVSEPEKLKVYIDNVKIFDIAMKKMNPYLMISSTDNGTTYTASELLMYKLTPDESEIPSMPASSSNLINSGVEYGTSGTNTYANGNVNITSAGAVNFYGVTGITADDTFVLSTKINISSFGVEGWMSPRIMVRNTDNDNYYEVAFLRDGVYILGAFTDDNGDLQGYGWGPYINTSYKVATQTDVQLDIVSAPTNIKVFVDGVKLIDVDMKKMNPLVVFQSTDDGTTYTAKDVLLYNTTIRSYNLDATSGTVSGVLLGTTAEEFLAELGISSITEVKKDGVAVSANALVATGMTAGDYTISIKGDINGDSSKNILDLISIKNWLLNKTVFSNAQKLAGDSDNNSALDIIDLLSIKRVLLGIKDGVKIGAFCGIDPQYVDERHIKEISDAGIEFIFVDSTIRDVETISNIARWCLKYDIEWVLTDSNLYGVGPNYADADKITADYSALPNFAGNMIYDEPGASKFSALGQAITSYKGLMNGKEAIINLLPNYATTEQLGTATYEQYINEYVAKVPTDFICVDFYPCTQDENKTKTTYEGYCENLNIVSSAARANNREFWGFIQTTTWSEWHRLPDETDIRWQMYTHLAFGASRMFHFTYTTPDAEGYTLGAMLDERGEKTALWYAAQKVNAEIEALSDVYVNYKSLGAFAHNAGNKDYLTMSKPYTEFDAISDIQCNESLLIGCFESAKNNSKAFTVVNMSDLADKSSATVSFKAQGAKTVTVYNNATATQLTAENGVYTLTLDSGAGAFVTVE